MNMGTPPDIFFHSMHMYVEISVRSVFLCCTIEEQNLPTLKVELK